MARNIERTHRETWIIDAVRTPIGRYGGALGAVRPDDLAATVIRALVDRTGIDPAVIEDVVLGCANQAGEDNRNVARMAALLAGLPVEVGGQTVNRLCGSGLQAVNSASHAIGAGDGDVFIAGGVESMTRAPYVMLKAEAAYDRGPRTMEDTTLGWRFVNPRMQELYPPISLGETAELVADRYAVARDRQDAFALESQRRAGAAIEAGRFDGQLVPVSVPGRKGAVTVVDPTSTPAPRRPPRRSRPCARRSGPADRSRPATAPASTTAPPRSCSPRRIARATSASCRWPGSWPPPWRAFTRMSWASGPCRRSARRSSGPV